MANTTSLFVLITGVLIGSSAAGIVAHTLNYISGFEKRIQWGILLGYVIVLTAGLMDEYQQPVVIFITSFFGIVIVGGQVFNRLKKHLPSDVTIEEPDR